jgi:hypothetical protein
VIFLEYAVDVAAACREAGLKTVAVTAGYITADARKELFAMTMGIEQKGRTFHTTIVCNKLRKYRRKPCIRGSARFAVLL